MKILLISPASGNWKSIGRSRIFGGKTFRFSLLGLLYVAAETPEDIDVELVDEQIEDIPFDADVDLVAIGCMTALAPRAYEIADRFRASGTPVVLGGMHPSFMPEEALGHADAVLIGEAEGVWPTLIEDFRRGELKSIYRREGQCCLEGLKRPMRELLRKDKYATVQAVQATRGCPHECAFCSVTAFNNNTYRKRPLDEVIAEIEDIGEKFFIFIDDNLTADLEYAEELFQRIKPLGKLWVTQTTLQVARHPGLVKTMAEAGCVGVFVGLETFSTDNMDAMNKDCHKIEEYERAISLFHSNGIGVEAGIVFGFDGDDEMAFQNTLAIVDRLQVDVVQTTVFTPLPGTPQFSAMKDRLKSRDWSKFDFHTVIFEPKKMSVENLQAGHDWFTREFYKPWRILRRTVRHLLRPRALKALPYILFVNFGYFGRVVRWKIRGWNPAKADSTKAAKNLSQANYAIER